MRKAKESEYTIILTEGNPNKTPEEQEALNRRIAIAKRNIAMRQYEAKMAKES